MINRKDIKSNFLNQIIFRLDFDVVAGVKLPKNAGEKFPLLGI